MVERERTEFGFTTWVEAERAAANKVEWQKVVDGPIPHDDDDVALSLFDGVGCFTLSLHPFKWIRGCQVVWCFKPFFLTFSAHISIS